MLEFFGRTLVKSESSDTLKLTHGFGLQTCALLTGNDALGSFRASVLPITVPDLPGWDDQVNG